MGLRHTIGIAAPVVIGALRGDAPGGMIAGIGALNVAVGDGADPYVFRMQRMLAASLLCAVAVTAGGIAGGTYVVSAILAASAFAAGMMPALGQAEADIGTIVLVTLIVFSAKPLPSQQAIRSGLLALGGGLWQTALGLALWPLRKYEPERTTLAALYRELSRAAAEDAQIGEAPPASRESTAAQESLASLDPGGSVDAERYLALLSQAERIRLSLMALTRLRMRIRGEAGGDAVIRPLEHFAKLTSEALGLVVDSLSGAPQKSGADLSPAMERLAHELRAAQKNCPQEAAPMAADACAQVQALGGQLRMVLAMAAQTTVRGRAAFERVEAARPRKLQFTSAMATLAANLRLDSAAFRHALRLAVCVTVGEIVPRELGWVRPYWVPMTVALVLKPDFTTTFSRGLQRLLGTLAGLLIATALVHSIHPTPLKEIVLVTVFAFVLRTFGPANYGILAIGVTGLVVFLFAVAGVSAAQVVVARGLDTLAGGAIALLAYRLWPTWERTQAADALAGMLDAYRAYFRSVAEAYANPNGIGAALERTRLAARRARSRLEESVSKMRAEPATGAQEGAQYARVLADSHRLIHAVMSLEAGLASRQAPRREEFRKFAEDVDLTLYYLAEGLRSRTQHPVTAADLPDLRADHGRLVEAGDASVPRYALVNVETDRVVNSLNTLTGEILPMIPGASGSGSG